MLVTATEAKKKKSGGSSGGEEENLGGRLAPPVRLVLALFTIFLVLQALSLVPTAEAKKGKGSGGGGGEEDAAVRLGSSGMAMTLVVAVFAAVAGVTAW